MSFGNHLQDARGDGGNRASLDDPEFESFLRARKRHGCNLLVTGDASDGVFATLTRRLLGTPSERRFRLLALTDATPDDADDLLPGDLGVEDATVRMLDYDSSTTRNAITEAPSPTSPPNRSDLIEFQDDVCDAIAGIEAEVDELAPSQLRVGVVTLCPFVSAYRMDAVTEFVRTVGSAVLRARGLAHYRLPTSDDAIVEELQPEFDARVEVRKGNGHPPVHRWHVPEHDLTTPWVAI